MGSGSEAAVGGRLMIVKTLAELAEPDLASLVIRPLDIDPAKIAEGVAEYRQRQVASFELVDAVPDSTRMSYERIRRIYSYGVLDYDLYTVAGNQARLVVEQALRDRFLPFYGGTPVFIDGKGGEHPVLAGRFGDLYDADRPLVRKSWRLKIQSGRHPIPFNGMLSSLLRWARAEGLLGGQRDRWQDKFRILFRNYTAHSEYHREMPDDTAAEIFHLAQLINRLWGAPGETPIRREVVAIAWSATATSYGLAEHFRIDDRMPADATCAVILADPQDLTLGDSFDAQYEMTAMPYQFLWGPGTWAEGAEWVKRQQPVADEIATVDRLFLLPAGRIANDVKTVVRALRQGLESFTVRDSLLLVGDLRAIAWASAIAADITNGHLKILQWNGRRVNYECVEVELWPSDAHQTDSTHVLDYSKDRV